MTLSPAWAAAYPPGMATRIDVPTASLVDAWQARVRANPSGKAIVYFDGALSAAELDGLSDAFAAALQTRGIGYGDRIGIQLQNIPQYAIAFLALWKLGAIAVLMNPMYKERELRHLIEDSGARGILADDSLYQATKAAAAGSSVEWILTTSGLEYQSRTDPRIFSAGEPAPPSPDGNMADWLAEFAGQVPDTPALGQDDVALLAYTSGTTGAPKGAMNTHGNILNVAATCTAWMGLEPGDTVLAVAPLFHITGAVIDAAAGPQIVPGYWNNLEATARTMPGGRLRTGDVATMDESGWVYIVDRMKDQINVSGYKVWPREVEDVLYEHPAVYEAAVVGMPDAYRGETVVAYVSLKPGRTATEEELIAFTKERLAAYKYPRSVYVIDDLPKTQTGKIRRRELRETPKEG